MMARVSKGDQSLSMPKQSGEQSHR